MQTRDEVEGLHICLEFSQLLEFYCLIRVPNLIIMRWL